MFGIVPIERGMQTFAITLTVHKSLLRNFL